MDGESQVNYSLERAAATQLGITVCVPYGELSLWAPKAAAKISEETEIEGFRKGHAPYEVVKTKVGEFKILEEAARMYIAENFKKILADIEDKEYKARGQSFEPVGEPQVAITKLAPGEDLEFKITLSLLPAIELPDYKAIATRVLATKKVEEVTGLEVQSSLDRLRESRAKLITVNRGAQLGDRVEIDFSASHGGVKIEGGESKNHPFTLGTGRFMPGFENQLVGMKAGEEKSFSLAVPQEYREKSIAGKALDFRAAMKLVQRRDVPEWNDDFAKSIGNFSSAADVEKNVRDGLGMEKEEKEGERLKSAMLEAIADGAKIEIPEPLIANELEKMTAELQHSIAGMGLAWEQYLAHIKKTEEALRQGAEWREQAERRVKFALILREIAKKEGIHPSEEETQAAANRTIAHQGMDKTDLKTIDREAFISYAAGIARNEKVLQFLEAIVSEP